MVFVLGQQSKHICTCLTGQLKDMSTVYEAKNFEVDDVKGLHRKYIRERQECSKNGNRNSKVP